MNDSLEARSTVHFVLGLVNVRNLNFVFFTNKVSNTKVVSSV
jgi:hypothetical protein